MKALGWRWEAIKMVAYIAFPVSLFHWFNQPENFTDYVEEVHRLYVPKVTKSTREQVEAFIEAYNKEKELQSIEIMETSLTGKK